MRRRTPSLMPRLEQTESRILTTTGIAHAGLPAHPAHVHTNDVTSVDFAVVTIHNSSAQTMHFQFRIIPNSLGVQNVTLTPNQQKVFYTIYDPAHQHPNFQVAYQTRTQSGTEATVVVSNLVYKTIVAKDKNYVPIAHDGQLYTFHSSVSGVTLSTS
jgi:hypothetical protein